LNSTKPNKKDQAAVCTSAVRMYLSDCEFDVAAWRLQSIRAKRYFRKSNIARKELDIVPFGII
jgi:hypothetical protein